MLDLKLLTTFREVAVRRSFSDAAAVLSFTQPAVSQHISRLEESLGTRLLERDAPGVKLTPSGETLLRHASLLLDASRRAEEEVRLAAGIGRARVRVAAFATAAAGLLPGAKRELGARRRLPPRPPRGCCRAGRASSARAGPTRSLRCR